MGEDIRERVIKLSKLNKLTAKKLEDITGISYDRWTSIRARKNRASDDMIEELVKLYPQYAYWLTTGDVMPECGQTSPDWDEAEKLNEQERA